MATDFYFTHPTPPLHDLGSGEGVADSTLTPSYLMPAPRHSGMLPPSDESRTLLARAMRCWENWASFREDRQRNKRYTYGRQWDDLINVNGEMITEKEYIARQGQVPLKNNLIRRMVRNVLGTYINSRSQFRLTPDDTEGCAEADWINRQLEKAHERNRYSDFSLRQMEEFLISGLAVCRKWHGERNGITGCWTDHVSPDMFFMETPGGDSRGWNVTFLGEIHDLSFGEVCCAMAGSPRDFDFLKEVYSPGNAAGGWPAMPDRCRVYEIWRKETVVRYRCHDKRTGTVYLIDPSDYGAVVKDGSLISAEWTVSNIWSYCFLSPSAHILRCGETPFLHGEHPYVFKAYPFIDGEIHSFVSDVIDQQRYTNRLVTLYDWIMRASAKGVLLFPEECMPQGWSVQDVADEWSRFNGVIMIKAKEGCILPQQVSNKAVNIGITELLNIQLKMFEDISGVTGTLQGKLENGNVSGTLYRQQTQNALSSLQDVLESFRTFETEGALKDISLIRQYQQ